MGSHRIRRQRIERPQNRCGVSTATTHTRSNWNPFRQFDIKAERPAGSISIRRGCAKGEVSFPRSSVGSFDIDRAPAIGGPNQNVIAQIDAMKDGLDAVKSRRFPRKNAEVKVKLGLRYDASGGPAAQEAG